MSLELFAAGAMLVGLVIYALTGGADFGGGIWDLLASGPRAAAQRDAIEHAIAPVWEANHVWLIFVVTVMFTAFPPAFAHIGIELHVPLTILLLGIVLRGAAFVFRQYGPEHHRRAWGLTFAISSTVATLFLGIVLGAITHGSWLRPFPLAVGLLALTAFAFVAATYLAVEATDPDLRADFRRRALLSGNALAVMATLCGILAAASLPRFAARLFGGTSITVIVLAGAVALVVTLRALHLSHFRLARAACITVITLLVSGWAFAQYPLLVAPNLTIARAAAPSTTLAALVPILLAGSLVLLPSLWWLMRVFKSQQAPRPRDSR